MTHFLYILGLVCNYNVTFGISYYTQWMVRFYHMTGLLISWVFLGVAETIVCSLLCCGVGIVQCLFNLLYYVIGVRNTKKPPIFRTVMEPWNSGKSVKSCEIHKNSQNTVKFARNLIQYMSIQHVWNLSQLLGLFNCRKLANSSWNFITTTSEQRPKTTRR